MFQAWINAVIANSLLSFGIWYLSAKINLTAQLRITIVAVSFITPIIPPTGVNRLLYLTDILTPLLAYFAIKSRECSTDTKIVASFLLASAGLMPFIFSFGFAGDYVAFMSTASNFWRSIAVASIFIIIAGNYSNGAKLEDINKIIIWSCSCLALILVSQIFLGFDTNIYEKLFITDNATDEYTFDPNKRYWILGMFKAQIGYLGMILFAYALFLSQKRDMLTSVIACASVALLLMITSGSKTSLICSFALLLIAASIRPKKFIKRLTLALALLVIPLLVIFQTTDISKNLNVTLVNFVTSRGNDVETLDYRYEIWNTASTAMGRESLSILGIYTEPAHNFKPGFFHNEYLSIFALGGIQSLAIYIFLVCAIFYKSLRKTLKGNNLGLLALLTASGGIIQAWAVAHLQPSVLFITSSSLCVIIYGIIFKKNKKTLRENQ